MPRSETASPVSNPLPRRLARAMAVLGHHSNESLPAVLLRGERIPYGVAIAAASLAMLDRLPFVPGA